METYGITTGYRGLCMSDSVAEGTLELHKNGCGFLRMANRNYSANPTDPFVSRDIVKRYALNGGAVLSGRTKKKNGRFNEQTYRFCLQEIEKINFSLFCLIYILSY